MPKNVVGAVREYSRTCVNRLIAKKRRLIAKKAVGKHQLTSLTLAKRHTLGYMQAFCDKPSDFTAMLHKTTHLWKALWRPSRTLWLCIARACLRNKTLACAQTKKHSGVCDAQCYQRQAPKWVVNSPTPKSKSDPIGFDPPPCLGRKSRAWTRQLPR